MSPDLFEMTDEFPIPMPMPHRKHSWALIGNLLLLILIVLYLITLALPALATDSGVLFPLAINRSLPGSRMGILTKAQGPMLQIDRTTYMLTPAALVEDKFGTPLSVSDMKWNEVEFKVQYWVARDPGPNQIMQLVINFPE